MKNGILITIGVAVWAAIKGAAKLLKIIITLLTEIVIFLGLYIPLFYLLFGVVMLAVTDFTLGGTGADQIIYYVGLGASFVAAVIIAIRNAIVRPFSAIFAPLVSFFGDRRKRRDDRFDRGDDAYEREEYPCDDLDRRSYRDRYVDPALYDYDREGHDPRTRFSGRDYDEEGAPADPYASYGTPDRGGSPAPYARREYDRDYPSAPYSGPRGDYRDAPLPESAYVGAGNGYASSYDETRTSDNAPARYSDARGAYAERNVAPRTYGDSRDLRFAARPPRDPEAERPLIYYSQRRPSILVKEYSDRFELYREEANGRVYVGTEYKDE